MDSTPSSDLQQRPAKHRGDSKHSRRYQARSVSCQVPGCERAVVDKAYFKRYCICQHHWSLPSMVLAGQHVRWCQQCGRFHAIDAFEGDKKSCRERLLRHNARRRGKAVVPTASKSRKGKDGHTSSRSTQPSHNPLSSGDVSGSLSSGPRPTRTSARLRSCAASRAARGEPASSSHPGSQSTEGDEQHWRAAAAAAAAGGEWPGLAAARAPAAGGEHLALSQLLFEQRLLLDNANLAPLDPLGPQSEAGRAPAGLASLPQMLPLPQPHQLPGGLAEDLDDMLSPILSGLPSLLQQQPPAGLEGGLLGWPAGSPPEGQLPQAGPGPEAELKEVMDLLQWLHDDSGTQWLQDAIGSAVAGGQPAPPPPGAPAAWDSLPAPGEGFGASPFLGASQFPLPEGNAGAGARVGAQPAYQAQEHAPALPSVALRTAASCSLPASQEQLPAEPEPLGGPSALPPPSLAGAPQLQQGPSQQQQQQQLPLLQAPAAARGSKDWLQSHLMRASIKLFDVTPDSLAPHVKEGLERLVASDPAYMDTCVRPGCALVTTSALLSPEERADLEGQGAKGLAGRVLDFGARSAEQGRDDGAWARNMLVQVGSEVAVVKGGQLVCQIDVAASAPRLVLAQPPALLVPAHPYAQSSGELTDDDDTAVSSDTAWEGGSEYEAGHRHGGSAAGGWGEGTVTLFGRHISGSHDMVVCRQKGRVLDLEVLGQGRLPQGARPQGGGDAPLEWVVVRPLHAGVGLLEFEVQRGGVLSAPLPVLGLPSHRAVEEVALAQRCLAGAPGYKEFLQALGLSLQLGGGAGVRAAALAARLATPLLATVRAHGWAELACLLEGAASWATDAEPDQDEQSEEQTGEAAPPCAAAAPEDSAASGAPHALCPDSGDSASIAAAAAGAAPPAAAGRPPAQPEPACAVGKLWEVEEEEEAWAKPSGSSQKAGMPPAPGLSASEDGSEVLLEDVLYEGVMGYTREQRVRPAAVGLEWWVAVFVALAGAAMAVRAAVSAF